MLEILIAVSSASKSVAASCSNSPFRLPVQPIVATVRTSWSDSSPASGLGSDSSSRRRTGSQKISGELKRGDRLLTLHGGGIVKELIEGIPGGQIVQKVLYRHPRSAKDWSAAEDLRVDLYNGIRRCHGQHRTADLAAAGKVRPVGPAVGRTRPSSAL